MGSITEKVSIRKVDKKIALEMLKNNTMNRKKTRANIDFVKNEIISGNFAINGATVVIATDGTLLDGQHRLFAVEELDVEVDMIIVENVNKKVFSTIDSGKNRTAGDVLSSKGIKNANGVASAIRRIIEKFSSNRKIGKGGTVKISNTEILSFYEKNKDTLESTYSFCHSMYQSETRVITASVATAMIFLLSKEHKQKAKSFVREIYTGNREYESNAGLVLRKRLLNNKIDGIKLNDSKLRGLFISAFRNYKQGKDVSRIQLNNDLSSYTFKE